MIIRRIIVFRIDKVCMRREWVAELGSGTESLEEFVDLRGQSVGRITYMVLKPQELRYSVSEPGAKIF